LSILILSPWTLYLGSNLPYLVRSVNLSKNLYLQPSVIDTDHPASDYWWDGKFHDKIDLRQKSLSFNATPPSILTLISAPSTSILNFQHFSTTSKIGDPNILLHLPHRSKSIKFTIPIILMPCPPLLAQVSQIFISTQITTHFDLYSNLRFVKPPQHQQQIMNNQHTNKHTHE
jgi:hypothetical protein